MIDIDDVDDDDAVDLLFVVELRLGIFENEIFIYI